MLRASSDGDPKASGGVKIEDASPAAGPAPAQISSLKLSYRFERGWRFGQVRFSEARAVISGNYHHSPWNTLGLWLHGDGKGCQARVRFKDSTGQVFQADGPKIDWKGWRYVTFPIQSTEEKPLTHWGGAKDGVIHYPIEWDSIFLLDNVSRQPVEGEIYLSAPTLIY
jgi:polysaccharide biosynthesis protein PslG